MSIVSVRSVREVTNEQYLEAYQQYYPCLCKSSKSWINRYGHDEALHIAGIALWRALQSYDESRRMTFISYLINCIRWSFLDQYGDEDKNQCRNQKDVKAIEPCDNLRSRKLATEKPTPAMLVRSCANKYLA